MRAAPSLQPRHQPRLRVVDAVDSLEPGQRERLLAHPDHPDVVQFRQRRAEHDGAVVGEELRGPDLAAQVVIAELFDADVADPRRPIDDVAPRDDAPSMT